MCSYNKHIIHDDRNSYLALHTDYTYDLGNGMDSMLWIQDWDSRSHCIFFAVTGTAFLILLLHSPKKVTSLNKTGLFTLCSDI